MKTLILTDFTSCARNAADYAFAMLGKDKEAHFILLNTFKIDILGNTGKTYDELRQESARMLEEEKKRLAERFGIAVNRVSYKSVEGRLNYLNEGLLDELGIDMVIMGTEGLSEEEKYLGTTHAGEVVISLKRNVLVVPNGATFRKPYNNVLFATDYQQPVTPHSVRAMESIVNGAQMHMLHVSGEERLNEDEKDIKEQMAKMFEGHKLVFQHRVSDNVEESVKEFVRSKGMDAIIVLPRHSSFFELMFHLSVSRKLAHNTPVPLLALH